MNIDTFDNTFQEGDVVRRTRYDEGGGATNESTITDIRPGARYFLAPQGRSFDKRSDWALVGGPRFKLATRKPLTEQEFNDRFQAGDEIERTHEGSEVFVGSTLRARIDSMYSTRRTAAGRVAFIGTNITPGGGGSSNLNLSKGCDWVLVGGPRFQLLVAEVDNSPLTYQAGDKVTHVADGYSKHFVVVTAAGEGRFFGRSNGVAAESTYYKSDYPYRWLGEIEPSVPLRWKEGDYFKRVTEFSQYDEEFEVTRARDGGYHLTSVRTYPDGRTETHTYTQTKAKLWDSEEYEPVEWVEGYKIVGLNGTSYLNYQWPLPISAPVVVKADPGRGTFTTIDECPTFMGDGLCVAKSIGGAQSGGRGFTTSLVLLLRYRKCDILKEGSSKVRVSRVTVTEAVSPWTAVTTPRIARLLGDLNGLPSSWLNEAKVAAARP